MTSSMPSSMPSCSSSDDPMIDLEISLGRIQYDNAIIKKEEYNPHHSHHLTRIRNISSSSHSSDQQQQQQQQQQQEQQQQQQQQQSYSSSSSAVGCCSPSSNTRQTRTSSKTPFLPDYDDEANAASSNLLKPYPISETVHEITERRRSLNMMGQFASTTASFDDNNQEQDQRSMMEVTVMEEYYADDINVPHDDDFVLSAEEAGSMIDESLDTRTIQDDPGSFWEQTTPVVVTTTNTNRNQNTNTNQGLSLSTSSLMDAHTSSPAENLMSSVPFSVSFSSSNHHPHDDSFEDETADASPIRSSDMEW